MQESRNKLERQLVEYPQGTACGYRCGRQTNPRNTPCGRSFPVAHRSLRLERCQLVHFLRHVVCQRRRMRNDLHAVFQRTFAFDVGVAQRSVHRMCSGITFFAMVPTLQLAAAEDAVCIRLRAEARVGHVGVTPDAKRRAPGFEVSRVLPQIVVAVSAKPVAIFLVVGEGLIAAFASLISLEILTNLKTYTFNCIAHPNPSAFLFGLVCFMRLKAFFRIFYGPHRKKALPQKSLLLQQHRQNLVCPVSMGGGFVLSFAAANGCWHRRHGDVPKRPLSSDALLIANYPSRNSAHAF